MSKENDLLETEEKMRDAADMLTEFFPGMAICLIVFPFYVKGVGNYISNARRDDMIEELKSIVNRLETNQDIPAVMPGKH